jgi:hypothetical protein
MCHGAKARRIEDFGAGAVDTIVSERTASDASAAPAR